MQNFLFLQNYHYNQTHWQHTNTYQSLSSLRLLTWLCKARKKKKNEIIKIRKPHQNVVPCDVNANMQCQITSVSSLIKIFVTEILIKEYDMYRDLWLIAYFRCQQIDRNCVVPYVFSSIHIYFFWKKKLQPGRQPGRKPFNQVIWPGAPWPPAATDHIMGNNRNMYFIVFYLL